jgi:hypothetical protein
MAGAVLVLHLVTVLYYQAFHGQTPSNRVLDPPAEGKMPMARNTRGDDSTAARKLARSAPMSGRGGRADESPRHSNAIERLVPGSDPGPAIAKLYAEGRRVYGTNPDARRDARTPEYKVPSPSRDERASYGLGKNSPVTPAPSEYGPQFEVDKKSDRVDTREAWCRGMAKQQHPYFDSGPSGSRYSRK